MTSDPPALATPACRTRWATTSDLPALRSLMRLAIDALQVGLLSAKQIEASHELMGLDTQLVEDRTYLIAEADRTLVGCGGWSRRATLYGGDHSTGLRRPRLLDPTCDPARIRAMYTHPDFARRGVGRMILLECERAAREAGYASVELMATLSGQRLYAVSGYLPIENTDTIVNGVSIPLVRMRKTL